MPDCSRRFRASDRRGSAFAQRLSRSEAGRPVISIEVELKLAAAAADLAALTRALVAMTPGAVAVRRTLVATYFDTPDLALKQAGSILRVRDEDGRFVQTFKTADFGGADLLARGEWQDTVDANRPDPQAPHSGLRLPEGVTGDLHPLFVTEVVQRPSRSSRFLGHGSRRRSTPARSARSTPAAASRSARSSSNSNMATRRRYS